MAKEKDLMELVEQCGVAKSADTTKAEAAKETAALLAELGMQNAANSVYGRVNPIIKKAEIAAGGYIEITPEKIQQFLDRRAKSYNEQVLKKRASAHRASDTVTALREYFLANVNGRTTNVSIQSGSTTTSGVSGADVQRYYDAVRYQQMSQFGAFGIGAMLSGATSPDTETFRAPTMDYTSGGADSIGQYLWTEVTVGRYPGIPPMKVLHKFREEKAKNTFDYFTIASVNAVRDPLLLGRVNGSTSRYFIDQWGDDVSLDDVI